MSKVSAGTAMGATASALGESEFHRLCEEADRIAGRSFGVASKTRNIVDELIGIHPENCVSEKNPDPNSIVDRLFKYLRQIDENLEEIQNTVSRI